jgi:putative glycosyltransferase (TIGR04372 family)
MALDDAMTARVFSNENMQTFLRLTIPFLKDGQRVLAYILPASGRFAHMALEPWALDNLFGDAFDRIVVIIHDKRHLPYSTGMHKASSEVVSFVETHEELILMLGHYDSQPYENGPLRVQLQTASSLLRDLWRHVRAGGPPRYLALPTSLEHQAARFLSDLGVGAGDRFVTVHMRESSYLAAHRYHAFRNITPAHYEPAIRHLLEQGTWVFRLGDKQSTRFGIEHPRFVDLPFLEGYEDFMDVVLLAKARFAICCSSGPEGPVRAFGTPMLLVNAILEQQSFLNPRDVIQFKSYVDDHSAQPIPYATLLDRGISGYSLASQFEEAQVSLRENSAKDILAAVKEMQARLDGAFDADPCIDQTFRAANEAFLARIEVAPEAPDRPGPVDRCFGLALPWSTVCHDYCRANPWFLGTGSV